MYRQNLYPVSFCLVYSGFKWTNAANKPAKITSQPGGSDVHYLASSVCIAWGSLQIEIHCARGVAEHKSKRKHKTHNESFNETLWKQVCSAILSLIEPAD